MDFNCYIVTALLIKKSKKVLKMRNQNNAMYAQFKSLADMHDGENCINVWIHGATKLGRGLDKAANLPFKHNKLGPFASIDGIWNYLLSGTFDDRLRYLHGRILVKKAREFVREKDNIKQPVCINFRAAILDSTRQKIIAYPELMEMIIISELPFDCWFVDRRTKVKQRPVLYSSWFTNGLEEIRSAFKEDRSPDFTPWMRDTTVGYYDDVLQNITSSVAFSNEENSDDDTNKELSIDSENTLVTE
jgi:hypothetical protein